MKKWEISLTVCVVLAVIYLFTWAVAKDKNNRIYRINLKNDFFSQCQGDGYKATDCYVKWKSTR